MNKLYSVDIKVGDTFKEIAVFCDDATQFDAPIDILTTSAFLYSYNPSPRSIFQALDQRGVSVRHLASEPFLDLRNPCRVWLSKEIQRASVKISRIGCIEFQGNPLFYSDSREVEQSTIQAIRAYFRMLDLAEIQGVPMGTVALPLVGSGLQHISSSLLLIPLIDECVSFLNRNRSVSRIYFIEKNPEKAAAIAQGLQESLLLSKVNTPDLQETQQRGLAFISYASPDKNIADNLCAKLESQGIKVWYAPRDCSNAYASAIVNAIRKSQYFIVILSKNSLNSNHVLNEVCLGFNSISNGTKFKPLRIDDALFTPSFEYYLACQHWMDATIPPLEERLSEFVRSVLTEENK